MPTDLAALQSRPTQVLDRSGSVFPFSKGILATSILATGLETERAYDIAAEVGRRIGDLAEPVTAEALTAIAASAIERRAGRSTADRYLAWRRARRSGKPIVICLGGAPGVGKSTLATRLAVRLGIKALITTDAIREVLRTVVPPAVSPELHVSTYESIRDELGDSPPLECFRRQARAVGAASVAVATRLAKEGRSVLIEGVHLIPGRIRDELGRHGVDAITEEVLLVLGEEAHHRDHLVRRMEHEPARDGQRTVDGLETIRRLQSELRRAARAAGVPECEVRSPENLTQLIVDRIATHPSLAADFGAA